MPTFFPYARELAAALGSVAVSTAVLAVVQGDWLAAMFLSVVIVFTIVTLLLVAHGLVAAIRGSMRRRRDDGPGGRNDYGLAA